MRDHTKLRVFELADEVALLIYQISKQFGLASQLRSSAFFVPSNIVEGFDRENQVYYLRFLNIAFGSLESFIIN